MTIEQSQIDQVAEILEQQWEKLTELRIPYVIQYQEILKDFPDYGNLAKFELGLIEGWLGDLQQIAKILNIELEALGLITERHMDSRNFKHSRGVEITLYEIKKKYGEIVWDMVIDKVNEGEQLIDCSPMLLVPKDILDEVLKEAENND